MDSLVETRANIKPLVSAPKELVMAEDQKAKNYCYEYPRPALTADCIILKRKDGKLWLLAVTRKKDPYQGRPAFPGGFFDEADANIEASARRELKEEVGLEAPLRLFNVYSQPGRDPRGRTVTVAYWGFVDENAEPTAGDDAADAQWYDTDNLPNLAFDHSEIIREFLKRMKNSPEEFEGMVN